MLNFINWLTAREDLSKLVRLTGSETKFIGFSDGKIFYGGNQYSTHDTIWAEQALAYARQKYSIQDNAGWYEAAKKIHIIRGIVQQENKKRIVILAGKTDDKSMAAVLNSLLKDKLISLNSEMRNSDHPYMKVGEFLKNNPGQETSPQAPTETELRDETMKRVRAKFRTEKEYQDFLARMKGRTNPSSRQLPPSRDPGDIVDRINKGLDPYV